MLSLFALTSWFMALTVAFFILATDVWQGAPMLHFVGAVALGMIGPLGTWAIVKRYPETDRAAWVCIGLTGGAVGIAAPQFFAILRLQALINPERKWHDRYFMARLCRNTQSITKY